MRKVERSSECGPTCTHDTSAIQRQLQLLRDKQMGT